VTGFYVSLVGVKAALAVLVAGGRHCLTGTGDQRTARPPPPPPPAPPPPAPGRGRGLGGGGAPCS
jgi:hypothetical protein